MVPALRFLSLRNQRTAEAMDDLERRRVQLQQAGAALRERHASALAMLAQRSSIGAEKRGKVATKQAKQKPQATQASAREDDRGEDTHRAMDLERVRAKLEAARARMSGPYSEIPTGREYDSPPDASQEHVYDALEKAYNAAFWAPPPGSGERSGRPGTTGSIFRQDEPQRSVFGRSAGETEASKTVQTRKDEYPAVKTTTDEQCAEHVGTLKSMCLSKLKQHAEDHGQDEIAHSEMRSDKAVRGESSLGPASSNQEVPTTSSASSTGPVSARSPDDIRSTSDQEPSAAMAPASGSAESIGTTVSAPQSPISVHAQSEDGMHSTPAVKEESLHAGLVNMEPEHAETAIIERADHLSLNEFLISELQVYCSRVLDQRASKRRSSDVSNLAQFTALQIYKDHKRALMDFDDEWKRSHADSYRGFVEDAPNGAPRGSISCNPFQEYTTGVANAEEWDTLVNKVKASSINQQAAVNSLFTWSNHEGCDDLFAAYKRGSNGVIVGGDNKHNERVQIGQYMGQLAAIQNTPAFHVVIAASSDLGEWETALLSRQLVQLYPYWGGKEDRQHLLQLLSNEYFSRRVSAHVLLTSYEVFMEDISVLTSLQCQITVIDIPGLATDHLTSIWPQLLSVRCRQRLLVCQPTFEMDARKLLHFLVPELFGSRRKLLAWNCAAFCNGQIREVCEMAKSFFLVSRPENCSAFITKLESCTREKSKHERDALEKLDKQGIVRGGEPAIKIPLKRLLPLNRKSGHIPAKGKLFSQKLLADPLDAQLSIQAPKLLPKKRRGTGDGTPLSRKRIGRCGKCAGCLTEDCMKCGHCQDMKKYGGPGLRKQSCKNRKCLNPKIWGYSSRKRRRSKAKRVDEHGGAGDADSVKYESEIDDDGTYSSVESDKDSVSTCTYGYADGSDSESLRYSDATVDSPRDLLLPASDTRLDNMSLSDMSSRSARSRVVRCGECAGCRAPDCMNCHHCRDMKKYGGPGLRKQSCKNRKCIAPKIVMLNQSKGDQYVDEHGNVVYSEQNGDNFPGFYEAPDSTETAESGHQTEVLSVIRECELFVEPQLAFACTRCTARFSSKVLLEFHARVEHSLPADRDTVTPTTLEQEASKLFVHPIYQNAILNGQLKQEDRSLASSPLGYAKLEGQDFQYFLIEPFVVLGRMNSGWRELYKDLGFQDLKGLAGGDVGCHVGNDTMIANAHAVISWDAHQGSFVIECLCFQTPISVNGQEVSYSSSPMVLRSRSLVQIGASVLYFLLPKATEASTSRSASQTTTTQDRRTDNGASNGVMKITTQQRKENFK